MWTIKDKTCLITGATSGIGRETALELARQGARVVITYRNPAKALETQQWIAAQTAANIDTFYCDLSSFKSIREFARKFTAKYHRLDVLINNAGIWETKRQLSPDGIELNFATNHLGPFLLTLLLLDTMKNSAPARIINLSSAAHKNFQPDFQDMELNKGFNGFRAYCQSKLANIWFAKQLAHQLRDDNITVNCAHPGVVSTNIFKNLGKIGIFMMKPIMITPQKGAQTSIYLATSDQVSDISGMYFAKKKIVTSSPASCDMDNARKLWDLSLQYVGWDKTKS